MNDFFLGNLFPTQTDLLNHLSEFGTMTDEQIIKKTSQGGGIDAEYALTLFAERDFCKRVIDNIINELLKIN